MSQSSGSSEGGKSWAVPTAIVLAGALVAGAVLYTSPKKSLSGSPSPAGTEGTQEEVLAEEAAVAQVSVADLADQVGLNRSDFDNCLASGKYASVVEADQALAQEAGVDGTPSYFINGRLLVGAQPYSEFKRIIEEELSGNRSSEPEANAPQVGEDDPARGDEAAPVTIIEFSDFLCPYCAAGAGFREQDVQAALKERSPGWEAAVPGVIRDYVDSGKVRLVFKALPFHGEPALKLAVASLCAKEQGKYWEMHDAIFGNQGNLEVQ